MEQSFEEYKEAREEAKKEFYIFLKNCLEKELTVQQLVMIGNFANEEIQKVIANLHAKTRLNANQCDLLQCKHE